MRKMSAFLILWAATVCFVSALFAQTQSSKWQAGTIIAVQPHAAVDDADPERKQYDVSIRVGDTLYVVLYTAPPGSRSVEYRAGANLQVLVEKDTLICNDLLGRANKVPVLRRETIPEQSH